MNRNLAWTQRSSHGIPSRRMGEPPFSCFLVDACAAFLTRGLRRRGFKVIAPGQYPQGLPDCFIVRLAEKYNCIIITLDRDFEGYSNAFVIPRRWIEKYNKWELVTKVIKEVFKRIYSGSLG